MNPPSPPSCGRDGAVMLGKLNLDEFAMGSSNESSAFGPGHQSVEGPRLQQAC